MKTLNPARWTFMSAALFIFFLVMLHFIKPQVDPSWNFISEYEVGQFGLDHATCIHGSYCKLHFPCNSAMEKRATHRQVWISY